MSAKTLKIEHVDRRNGDELVVGYSDKTTAVYGVDQITRLTPKQTAAAKSDMNENANPK
jgi:hypothetical protein